MSEQCWCKPLVAHVNLRQRRKNAHANCSRSSQQTTDANAHCTVLRAPLHTALICSSAHLFNKHDSSEAMSWRRCKSQTAKLPYDQIECVRRRRACSVVGAQEGVVVVTGRDESIRRPGPASDSAMAYRSELGHFMHSKTCSPES